MAFLQVSREPGVMLNAIPLLLFRDFQAEALIAPMIKRFHNSKTSPPGTRLCLPGIMVVEIVPILSRPFGHRKGSVLIVPINFDQRFRRLSKVYTTSKNDECLSQRPVVCIRQNPSLISIFLHRESTTIAVRVFYSGMRWLAILDRKDLIYVKYDSLSEVDEDLPFPHLSVFYGLSGLSWHHLGFDRMQFQLHDQPHGVCR